MTTPSLLDILQSTDMLEINGLHAWEFVLAPQALVAAHAALAAGQGGRDTYELLLNADDGLWHGRVLSDRRAPVRCTLGSYRGSFGAVPRARL